MFKEDNFNLQHPFWKSREKPILQEIVKLLKSLSGEHWAIALLLVMLGSTCKDKQESLNYIVRQIKEKEALKAQLIKINFFKFVFQTKSLNKLIPTLSDLFI